MRRRAVVALAAAAVVAAAVGGLLYARARPDTGIDSVRGITLRTFDRDGRLALDAFRGRPLVINLWATWCDPCVEEMPAFQEVYGSVRERVTFLGIDVQDDPGAARRFVRRTGVRYALASDPVAAAFKRMEIVGMPTTLFVDADGDVLERVTGPLSGEDLRSKIRRHYGV